MFSILLFLVFLCEFSESSQDSQKNEVNFHKKILTSLNATELSVSTLNVLLTRLKLQNCTGPENKSDCRHRCVTANSLFETYGLNKSETVSPKELSKLSTILLYFLLPEKNSGATKECKNGDDSGRAYDLFLRYYKTSGNICVGLLDSILRDLKNEFSTKQKCFTAVDLFNQMNLSTEHDEVGKEQFPTISIMIISHILQRKCVNLNKDIRTLPCKSYFISSLFGSESEISLNSLLENIGLENDNSESPNKCFSTDALAQIFLANKSSTVNKREFSEICPALIQQLKSKSCVTEEIHHTSGGNPDNYVWLYGFASVLLISLLSLAGIAVIPTMKGRMYKKIVIVLVGLAIGTLTGDALFHLIPHAAGLHAGSHGSEEEHDSEHDSEHDFEHATEDGKAFLWKFVVVASGVYGFFLFETFTHLFLRTGGHGHSHKIEHTRKHSQFERKNSCRTVERHEMRLTSNPPSETSPHTHDTTQVIYNKVNGKSEEKVLKPKTDDHNHEDNLPNLLTESSSHPGKKKISSVGWMIIIGDTIHNITDGIAIGAAFSQSIGGGLSTSIAVFCHELPHELGDFAVLVLSGMTVKQAMLTNFLTACSSFIGLVIGIFIGQQTKEGNQWVFAVMGGMFLYIALVDMLPELMHSDELGGAGRLQIFFLQNVGILFGFILMLLIAFFEEDLITSW